MNASTIITGPLGVQVITSTDATGHVEREVKWKRGHSSLVFAANEGRLEIHWRLIKDTDVDGCIQLPRTVWHWLQNFQHALYANNQADR